MLPRVHLIAPRLKRWLIGTLHYRVDRAQMSYYLDESAFRFQPTHRLQPRPALLPPAPTSRKHRPAPTVNPGPTPLPGRLQPTLFLELEVRNPGEVLLYRDARTIYAVERLSTSLERPS